MTGNSSDKNTCESTKTNIAAIDKIGIFFGSSTCYTDMVCDRLIAKLNDDYPSLKVQAHNIAETTIDVAHQYDFAIYGIPTWDYGELQEDWDNCWDQLQQLDLNHQIAAIYGLGDQVGYPQWYQDAIGYLFSQLQGCGANLCGLWPIDEKMIFPADIMANITTELGYQFEQSQGLNSVETHFLGLPLDEENQPELTDIRLEIWLQQVIRDFINFAC